MLPQIFIAVFHLVFKKTWGKKQVQADLAFHQTKIITYLRETMEVGCKVLQAKKLKFTVGYYYCLLGEMPDCRLDWE